MPHIVMERIEWVIKGSLFWNNSQANSRRVATLLRTTPDELFNARIAYVVCHRSGAYEAVLLRANNGTWTLGEFDNLLDAKNTIITALTIERMED